jgi:hypothetical protein
MRHFSSLSTLLLATAAFAGPGLVRPATPPPAAVQPTAVVAPPPPSDAQCPALSALKSPFGFARGETLEFDIDAMGAQAGKMTMTAKPLKDGALPVEVRVQTNTFFSKVRRVSGSGTSYLSPKTLRPSRYYEDATENEVRRIADVTFRPREHTAHLDFSSNGRSYQTDFRYGNEGLDVAGAVYAMRQLPLKEGLAVCFDVYGIRRMWRMSGKVLGKEHVSLPLGEFEAWHLAGEAVGLADPSSRREVHVWVTDDDRRLPLAALGSIDLGVVRATLTGFTRPGDKQAKAETKQNLKW